MTKGVVTCNLYKRKSSPSVNAERLGYFVSGDEIEIEDVVLGETKADYYEGTPTWYKLTNGIYVWSGGVSMNLDEEVFRRNLELIQSKLNDSEGNLDIVDVKTTGNKNENGIPYFKSTPGQPDADRFLHIDSINLPWWIKDYGINRIWSQERTIGEGANILVLDTGYSCNNPFGNYHNLTGWNYNSDNFDYDDISSDGHGTSVASIITSLQKECLGVAPGANIYISKAVGITKMIKALQKSAGVDEIDLIVMSYEFNSNSSNLRKFKEPFKKVVLDNSQSIFLSSIGNYGDSKINVFPAEFSRVMGIGSINIEKNISSFSNKVSLGDIYAPGEKIKALDYKTRSCAEFNGTSYSTPYVAGVLALMISYIKVNFPHRNHKELSLDQLLIQSADKSEDPAIGSYNIINPLKAFDLLKRKLLS